MRHPVPIILLSILIFSNESLAQRVAAGGRHSLSICSDSTVEAWGYNGYGQLGNGNISEQHSGMQIGGLSGVVHVAGGLFHSLFVKSDGTVWSCGRNTLGPLGDGTNDNRTTPVQVTGVSNITQAAGGGEHSLFVRSDGTVWACGNNSSGQLGDATNVSKNSPVQVSGLTGVIQSAAGAEFSLFLKSDGTVWACGHNGYGQFGNGTNKSSNVPVHISALSDIVQVSAGEWHSLFLKSDGTVFSSGRNQNGQLGDGTTVDKNTASIIPDLSDIAQAEAGGIHSVFLRSDGSVFACGLNSGGNNDGQLGDGTAIDRNTPVEVTPSWGSGTIVHVEATREHSLFVHSTGALWAAGRNNYGQLGYGQFTTANSLAPVASSTVCNTLLASGERAQHQENEIHISPNPGNGIVTVRSEKAMVQIEVLTILGEQLLTLANVRDLHSLEVDMTKMPAGVYLFRMTDTRDSVVTKKVLLR